MFTGITEQVGKIESLDQAQDGGRLRISFRGTATPGCAPENDATIAASTKLGDSISANGCCLTVVECSADHFSADLSGETLRRTNFAEKKPATSSISNARSPPAPA
jgi:riboflavin synthase